MCSRVTNVDRHRRRIDNVNLSRRGAAPTPPSVPMLLASAAAAWEVTLVYTDEKDVHATSQFLARVFASADSERVNSSLCTSE